MDGYRNPGSDGQSMFLIFTIKLPLFGNVKFILDPINRTDARSRSPFNTPVLSSLTQKPKKKKTLKISHRPCINLSKHISPCLNHIYHFSLTYIEKKGKGRNEPVNQLSIKTLHNQWVSCCSCDFFALEWGNGVI